MKTFSRRSALLSGAVAAAGAVSAQSPSFRRVLSSRYSLPKISGSLLPRAQWRPWPAASDRAAWSALPADMRSAAVERGEDALKGKWEVLPATLFLEFARVGNRSRYEAVVRARRMRLQALVFAECVEGKGRFAEEIGNGVWLQCEETWWGYPAHLSLQKDGFGLPEVSEPVIDLFAAEAAALLTWTDYLIGPVLTKVHPKIRTRLQSEVKRRIQVPFLARNDFWWMGLESARKMNNWNPWILSNCLASTLLIEDEPAIRAQVAGKVLLSLDRFLDSYHEDGGCDEGPGYWGQAGGSLFDTLEMLHSASAGKLNAFDIPLVQEIGRYIYRAQIVDDWFVNFADASAKTSPDGSLVYRYGKRIGDARMQRMGADIGRRHVPGANNFWRLLPSVFEAEVLRKAPAGQPLPRESWLPGVQVLTARSTEGSANGLFLAAQGGHNAESHNHNDVGNFIVFVNGQPALIDVGVETYSAKTFSSKRYEIWTMQSGYHNCPTVNGVMQSAGETATASAVEFRGGADGVELAMNIEKAYPEAAGIETWRRTLRLDRSKQLVEVADAWSLRKTGGELAFSLMTTCEVAISGNEVRLGKLARVRVEGVPVQISVEEIRTEDARLVPVWGNVVRRILVKVYSVQSQGVLRTIISSV